MSGIQSWFTASCEVCGKGFLCRAPDVATLRTVFDDEDTLHECLAECGWRFVDDVEGEMLYCAACFQDVETVDAAV